MSEGISQADLDALFAGISDTAEDTKTETRKDEGGGISQADLDALLGGIAFSGGGEAPVADAQLKMDDGWESPPATEENKGESLSQDDIDKMLAEFGLG